MFRECAFAYPCATRNTTARANAPKSIGPSHFSSQHTLEGLRDREQWAGTLIAFSTDNGPEEPMVFTNGVASANPFRCTHGRMRMRMNGGMVVEDKGEPGG